ncbi:MAG: 3-oxoacyl-ACP reductase family protein [Nitrososphaeria archaeon]
MEKLLQNKVAIVTGASRGIGRAIVLKFASEGAIVAFNYSSDDKSANELVEELKTQNCEFSVFKGSVDDSMFVKSVVEEVKKKYQRIDILVNNAGIIRDKPLLMMSEKDWDDVLNVNLKGTFYFTKSVISTMMAQRSGSIVNISSLTAVFGREAQCNYGAAKAGLIGFTKCLARELGQFNIRVNAIVCGLIDTRMTKQLPPEIKNKLIGLIPLKRMGQPEEVANVVLFLASEMSSYMTGAVINLTGGQYM